MFPYTDPKTLSRLAVLAEREKARRYMKFLYTLKSVWQGFGNRASWLIDSYNIFKYQKNMLDELRKSCNLADLKEEQICAEIDRLNSWFDSAALELGEARLDDFVVEGEKLG